MGLYPVARQDNIIQYNTITHITQKNTTLKATLYRQNYNNNNIIKNTYYTL